MSINMGMSFFVLDKFSAYPIVLINDKDKKGFCGFNIDIYENLMGIDLKDAKKLVQDRMQEVLEFVKENRTTLREHLWVRDEEEIYNIPEGTKFKVEIIRFEGIQFTEDRGAGSLEEAYPELHKYVQDNFDVKEIKYTPFGMSIFYQVEVTDGFEIEL